MESTRLILEQYGKLGVDAIRQDLAPYSRTGATAKSVHSEAFTQGTVDRLIIMGRAYISTMETGRGPRKSSEYGGLDLKMDEYLKSLNLPTKTSKNGIKYYKIGEYWFSAKSLAWKMNKEGDKTFKEGGRVIYSPTVDALIVAIKKAVRQDFKIKFARSVKNVFASLLLIACLSCSATNHVYVKDNKKNSMNKERPTPIYFGLVIFSGLVIVHVMTEAQ